MQRQSCEPNVSRREVRVSRAGVRAADDEPLRRPAAGSGSDNPFAPGDPTTPDVLIDHSTFLKNVKRASAQISPNSARPTIGTLRSYVTTYAFYVGDFTMDVYSFRLRSTS